jgi:hypothetical protein
MRFCHSRFRISTCTSADAEVMTRLAPDAMPHACAAETVLASPFGQQGVTVEVLQVDDKTLQ